jgi:hypothetical protein
MLLDFTNKEIYYVMMNDTAFRLNSDIPEYLKTAVYVYAALVRSIIRPSILKVITQNQLNEIFIRIKYQYQKALIDYGMAVGVIASQCTSEPLTQYVLHSIHHAVSGGTKKGGVAKFNEIISPKMVNQSEAIMTIYLKDNTMSTKIITTNIQILKFKEFVSIGYLIEELEYGKVIHPLFIEDKQLFDEFRIYFPSIKLPVNLIKWVFRFELNKEKLFLKNISLIKIIDSLRKTYTDAFIIHNNENSDVIVIRIYFKADMFSNYPEKSDMDELEKNIIETNIRGIEEVSNAYVEKENMVVEIAPVGHAKSGAIIKEQKEYIITTTGSNIYGLLKSSISKYIDPLRIISDSIIEVWDMFGIEEAKLSILEELKKITPDTNVRHLMIYAAEMCSSGIVTSIKKSGLKARHTDDILLRIAHQAPVQPLVYAAENNITTTFNSSSGSLIMGHVPKIGTHYNDIIINEKFVIDNSMTSEQHLDELEDI